MLTYAKGIYQFSVIQMENECVFVKQIGNHVEVSRGSKEDMKCLFDTWVSKLRSVS